ncbi:tyrosinase family protein [Streptomyces virginiae]|uniref:tyrosinase family protein n=1 Tax=Streptomyces virginiae TaxID=1961 RepID=UPI0022546138|nr:tyrosinase family protein [Streptomyces virginiae]MCX5276713.1 tyrosinase family protein [Streptomyces virginiae]
MSPQPVVHVRRNVWTLPEDDLTLTHYAAAVAEMKRRDADDPTSWSYQAAIHGTAETPPKPLWNSCKHGSWFFLSWHRMYLWYFERIVRAAVVDLGGPADWALPFWDYDADPSQARIPQAFRDEEGGANPLFADRAHRLNRGEPLPFQITSPAYAMGRTLFVGEAEFGGGITPDGDAFWNRDGAVENTPHNAVHSHIGRWMGRTDTAALDPIFWLHHANIDRLWFAWASRPGHDDPTDPRWITQEYRFFDADGSERRLAASAVVDIADQLGYTYESPVPVAPPPPAPPLSPVPEVSMSRPNASEPTPSVPKRREMAGASLQTVRLVGRAASVTVPIDGRTTRSLGLALGVPDPEADRRVYLNVEDIEGEENPETVYGIYVNLPDGVTPEVAESHRVGNLSFFGIERAQDPRGDEHPHGLRVTVEITPLVRRLVAQNAWDDQALRVTFLPLGPVDGEGEDPPVEIGRVSLGYT